MLQEIHVDQLKPSPTNPRKTFDDDKLQELAKSIREVGVLEPLIVRAHQNGGPPSYEIVAGERRYRAASLAGTLTVPCMVRELTDTQVLEVQVIENNQRDDVHPLEEAEGYAALMKLGGYDVDGIASKIGRSTKYVYDRVKLLKLIPALKKIFLAGEITAGHAILLARLSNEDQERSLDWDSRHGKIGGLFTADLAGDPDLDLDDPRCRKVVSVRELQDWIQETVRFRPSEIDLPNLFPETAVVLDAAATEKTKLVWITRHYRVPDEARDEKERTYGSESWKRADGEPEEDFYGGKPKKSKTCEHSVMGVVVAGEGYGTAFRVCVAKKKCAVHWKAEQDAANERGAPNGAGTKKGAAAARETEAERQRRWKEEQEREAAERARWKKAAPKLLETLAEKIADATVADLLDEIVMPRVKRSYGPQPKGMTRGKTIEDGIRYAAFLVLAGDSTNEYWIERNFTAALKRFGVSAKAIVNEVAPKPKPEKPAKKAEPGKGTGARARRRAKKKAKA